MSCGSSCVVNGIHLVFGCNNNTVGMELILPLWRHINPSFCVSLPFPSLGNDLEALQIHLCFCRSDLHPRRAARSGSTLVSPVSNIYLSQCCWVGGQEAAGDFRRSCQQTPRSPPAESCLAKRLWDGLDQCTRSHILPFQHLLVIEKTLLLLLLVIFPHAVDQCLNFLTISAGR